MQGERPQGNRLRRWLMIGAGVAIAAYAVLHWPGWRLRATMATGYGARMACSCRYIEGRDIKNCKSDFKGQEGMWMVRLSDDPAAKTVHASIPLLAARAAKFRDGFGCLPDKP